MLGVFSTNPGTGATVAFGFGQLVQDGFVARFEPVKGVSRFIQNEPFKKNDAGVEEEVFSSDDDLDLHLDVDDDDHEGGYYRLRKEYIFHYYFAIIIICFFIITIINFNIFNIICI